MGWSMWLKSKRRDPGGPGPQATPGPDAGPGSLVLTEGQRRHLEIAFRSLLTSAQETRSRIRERSAMAGESPKWVQTVTTEIDQLISETQRAATSLELSVDKTEMRWQRELAAWAATSWSMILDCRPSALRGYGPVNSRLARALEPVVAGIAARLLRIERVAEAAADPD